MRDIPSRFGEQEYRELHMLTSSQRNMLKRPTVNGMVIIPHGLIDQIAALKTAFSNEWRRLADEWNAGDRASFRVMNRCQGLGDFKPDGNIADLKVETTVIELPAAGSPWRRIAVEYEAKKYLITQLEKQTGLKNDFLD